MAIEVYNITMHAQYNCLVSESVRMALTIFIQYTHRESIALFVLVSLILALHDIFQQYVFTLKLVNVGIEMPKKEGGGYFCTHLKNLTLYMHSRYSM